MELEVRNYQFYLRLRMSEEAGEIQKYYDLNRMDVDDLMVFLDEGTRTGHISVRNYEIFNEKSRHFDDILKLVET